MDVPYKNASLSVEKRVEDLLQRMTLEEKIGQLEALLGWKMYKKNGKEVAVSELFKEEVGTRKIGMLWGFLRADPWTKKTLRTGLNPKLAADATNALQKYAMQKSRLGIPVFLAEESMHGHMGIGTTVFPTAIGQASTWNPALIEKMGNVIAKELRAQGTHIGYGPILDLAREPRWSRVEETFGEDPYLVSEMGKAVISGLQGDGIFGKEQVVSTLKHFAAYGVSEGGHNGGAVHLGKRELMESYLYPFKKAIDHGVLSVMTAYSSIDGIPSTAHKELIQDLLKDTWGFDGFVISDLGSIEGLRNDHHVVETIEAAATISMNAGVDVDLGGNAYDHLMESVEKGNVSMQRIDEAVRRVLRLKFEMGLFDNPYVDAKKASNIVRNKEHVQLAKQVARESVILLKNEGNLLPLSKEISRIAVIGPNADNTYNQLGDYTAPQDPKAIVSVVEGIQNKLPNVKVDYVKGTAIRDTTTTNIAQAVMAAKKAEAAIVVLGGSSARDFKTEYLETGAATVKKAPEETIVSDMESGEGFDRATLNLMGKQLELLKAIQATGTPTVLVLIKGRPLLLNWPYENIPAILDAWYPGEQGGNALADVIFGDYNPAGRLPISVPKAVGQLPVYYNVLYPKRRDYVEVDAQPLFPFGHGLSYTSFKYSNIEIQQIGHGEDLRFSVDFELENTGNRNGDEVVQLYIGDETSSVVTPVKRLRGFRRIHLKVGEKRAIHFELTPEDLALYNADMQRVAEAGLFEVFLGASSEDIRLVGKFRLPISVKLSP